MIGVFLSSLFGSIALGVPIAFTLVLSGIALMMFMGAFDSIIVAQKFIDGTNSYALLAIPFFILAGELMNKAGITKRIINLALGLVGHIRGGLGYVVIIASIIFAGLSGSAIAETAAIGSALIPIMTANGYDKNRATGIVVASGIIGPIIPPSIGLIIFGVVTGTSIVQLFIAGIIPGLLIGVGLMVVWAIVSRKDNMDLPERKSFKEIVKLGIDAFWALGLPIVIIGGLRFGVFTPTEAGVIAVVYALLIGLVIYRELKIKELYEVLLSTAKTTGVVMFIIGAASVTGWFITISNVTNKLADLLGSYASSPLLLMIMITILLLLVGMVMDITPSTLILAPVLMPIIQQAGIDPVYFGIVFMVTLTIGLLTPPIGVVLYTGMGISRISLVDALKGVWPFLLIEIVILFLIVLFPQLITVPLKFLM